MEKPHAEGLKFDLPIADVIKARYTAKKYVAGQTIAEDKIRAIKDLLRYCPSSTNAQPWHFILASSKGGKDKIAKSTDEDFKFNSAAIRNASLVVVFCSKLELDETFLTNLLEIEDQDGRYTAPQFKQRVREVRSQFIGLHRDTIGDLPHWIDKQLYLNVGSFLLGVAAMGIDATPMEGFAPEVLDAEFDLDKIGVSGRVVVPLGYHDPATDFNAKLPKSRLPLADIMTEV